MKLRPAGKKSEAGYALLFVYMMAAVVAIMLYSEMPRVAFEAQRDKEQLLIDRGEQYSRAILLYVRKNNRFPPDIDSLINTAGQRYLRRRFKDPMTGKDEWRLIHVGPGGVFTDSLLYTKKTGDKDKKEEQQTFITELQQVGGPVVDPNAQGGNIALRRRPSDQPGAPGSAPGADNGGIANGVPNGAPNGTADGSNGLSNGIPNGVSSGIPNGVAGGIPNGYSGQPGQTGNLQNGVNQFGQQPGGANGLQLPPGVQFPPGTPLPAGYGQASANGQTPGFAQTPAQPAQLASAPSASASNLINQILTTPRPGGLNGVQQAAAVDQFGNPLPQAGGTAAGPGGTTPAPMQGSAIGGGIGGVASKLEREGIKIYKDKTAYNEWEFVYDLSQDKSRQGLGTGAPGATPNGAAPGSVAATGQTGTQAAASTVAAPVVNAPPPAYTPPVYTPPAYTPPPQQQIPAPQPTTVAPDPGSNPANPAVPGLPGFSGTQTTQNNPGTPAVPNPVQPGVPVYPTPTQGAASAPGGIVPSAPIGGGSGIVPSAPIGGGIVPGAPVGGGTPH